MDCKHNSKSLWRENTVRLKCGKKIEANGPFWMRNGIHIGLGGAILSALWLKGAFTWLGEPPSSGSIS
jgi:hypothetical protein